MNNHMKNLYPLQCDLVYHVQKATHNDLCLHATRSKKRDMWNCENKDDLVSKCQLK